MVLMCQISAAQDIEKFVKDFSETKGVMHIKVGGVLFNIGKLFISKEDGGEVMKKITSIDIFTSENTTLALKENFLNDLAKFKDGKGFEMLVKVKDGSDNVTIFAERKKDFIKSLIIFVADQEDIVIVKLNGNIKDSDISALVNQHTKYLKSTL